MTRHKNGRKPIRLPHRDYAANGWYFVTICTKHRVCFFGDIVDGFMELSPIGKTAKQFWLEIPQHFQHTDIDVYIIMPNHIHGIVIIDNPNYQPCRDVACNVPTPSKISPKPGSLGAIIRSYKSAVTHWCRKNEHDDFAWQSRFYEHIIRRDGSLENIRKYIVNNPLKWEEDKDNPVNFID